MATQPKHYQGHPERFPRTTLARRTKRHAQRTPADRARLARAGRKPELTKASSGGSYDPTSRYLFHSSSSRCWWREGDLGPSKYGYVGANPQTRSIDCGAVARGSRLHDVTIHQKTGLQYDAPHQNRHAGPAVFPPAMGGGDASPR